MTRPTSSPSVRASRVLVQALAAAGVRHVVLAPGSRSAPLAYALAEAARPDAGRDPHAPRIDLHVRVDERAAGFLALGLARGARFDGSDAPVAVVTTSGTAVANLHPAVLEAHHAHVPLLLLTADRPHELRGTGANQTTDQVGLLGPGLRLTIDVPAPTGRAGEDRDVRRVAARAVAAATGARTHDPGPVHVDLAYREPLVPDDAAWPEPSRDGLAEVVRRGALADPAALGGTATAPLAAVPQEPGDGVRTVVVAGDGAGPTAADVAAANDWPLLGEPSSGALGGPHAIPAYRLLLDDPRLGGAVQRVVVLGRPTLSRPVQALLGRPGVEVLVVAPEGADWPDAARNATTVVAEVPPMLLRGCLGRDVAGPAGPWLEAWRRAGRAALEAVRAVGDEPVGASLTGLAVAAAVADATGYPRTLEPGGPAGEDDPRHRTLLVVGSSNPVRDLDLVADWAAPPVTFANRGLAGIDGTLSTAAGVALATGRPVRALVGDLTFLHDVGGLLVGPLERVPDLQVVVANDDGGSIFATLEHGEPRHAHVFERVFGTPHGADLGALCAGYGVAHRRVTTPEELRDALDAPIQGLSVVEAVVDRAGRRDLVARVADAVARALDTALHA